MKPCSIGFENVVRHLVLLSKQTFIATFVSRHVTTTNFSEPPPLELSAGPRAGTSKFNNNKNTFAEEKKSTIYVSGTVIDIDR